MHIPGILNKKKRDESCLAYLGYTWLADDLVEFYSNAPRANSDQFNANSRAHKKLPGLATHKAVQAHSCQNA